MTTITKLSNGECLLVVMKDEENEVRVHIHPGHEEWDPEAGIYESRGLMGLRILSAKLGLLYEQGLCVGGECEK